MSRWLRWVLAAVLGLVITVLLFAATTHVTYVGGPTVAHLHGAPAAYYVSYDPVLISELEVRDLVPWSAWRVGDFFILPFVTDWIIFSTAALLVVGAGQVLFDLLGGQARGAGTDARRRPQDGATGD